MTPGAKLLTARGVTKVFPGVRALDHVDFDVSAGEIVALVGENGAGKSTLMKLLAGIGAPTEGTIDVGSTRVALVHQELCLADNLTAGQNVCLGREPSKWSFIDERALHERAAKSLARVGARFEARTPLARLSIGEKQLVEIAAGLDRDADVLILDEPTSSLTSRESERLFEVLRSLRAAGIGIVYVSHRLPEVVALSDRAIVLRDGRRVAELEGEDLERGALVRAMIGRDEGARDERLVEPSDAEVALACCGVVTDAWPNARVSLEVKRGEIVGIAGLVGAGRTELLETIAGVRTAQAGSVELEGKAVTGLAPRRRYDLGLGFVPEDRAGAGIYTGGRVDENVTLATAHRRAKAARFFGGWIDKSKDRARYDDSVARLGVRAASPRVAIDSLSGGNQQKVIVGRWLGDGLCALVLDEPTRGVDVGARESLYESLEGVASEGAAVLFASSDLEEVRRLAQRILVMHDGEIAGELSRTEASEEAVMNLATGARLRSA